MQVFVDSNFWDKWKIDLFSINIFGVLQTFPPYKRSRPEIWRKLGTKEIGEFSPNVIFSLPSGFLFGMVAPLNFQKLDTSGASGSECFF